jgi:hypothetical protein
VGYNEPTTPKGIPMLCALIAILVNVALIATFITGVITIIKKIFK